MDDNRDYWDPDKGDHWNAEGAPDGTDAFGKCPIDVDKYCTAKTFWDWMGGAGAFRLAKDVSKSKDVLEWLMSPAPAEWISRLSADQKASRRSRDWSFNSRSKLDHPVSRLEYWSSLHSSYSFMPGQKQINYMTTQTIVKPEHEKPDGSNASGWSQELHNALVIERKAAKEIVHWMWGRLNGKKKGGFGSDKAYALAYKNTSWDDTERRFAEMISLNQGHGSGATSASDFPWHDANKWLDDEAVDAGLYGMVFRLTKSKPSIEHPFNPDYMSFFEKNIMSAGNYSIKAVKQADGTISYDSSGKSGEASVGQGTDMLRSLTIGQFEKTVTGVLQRAFDAEGKFFKVKMWDGVIPKDSSAKQGQKEVNLYKMWDSFTETKFGGVVPTGERNKDRDSTDVMKGFGYSEEKFDDLGDYDGIKKAVAMVSPRYGNGWLGKRADLDKQYTDVLTAIWSAGNDGYIKEADKNPAVKRTANNSPVNPLKIRDSGFIDWFNLVQNGNVNPKNSGVNGANTKWGGKLKKEARTYIPDKLEILSGGKVVNSVDLSSTNVKLVEDIKKNKQDGNPEFTGFNGKLNSTNPDAQKVADAALKAFYKFTGDETVGYGALNPQDPGAWVKANLSTGVLPATGNQTFTNTMLIDNLKLGDPNVPTTSTEIGKILKDALEGDQVKFTKTGTPWNGISRGSSGVAQIPFKDLLKKYVATAYVTIFYYRMYKKRLTADEKAIIGKPSLEEGLVWQWAATLCAAHMLKIWAKVVHDNECGNFYALIVALLATGKIPNKDAEALADALAALAGKSADDMVKDLGTEDIPPQATDPPAVSEADKAARERFYKQCALLLNMHTLKNHKDRRAGVYQEHSRKEEFTSYNGRVHLVSNEDKADGKKNAIINKLISPKPSQMDSFLNITPAQASQLLPYIRIYQVWNDTVEGLQEIEFDFPVLPERDVASQGFDRGDGVGVKEFSWEYDGETPATASKYIKANLSLYFQSFEDFIKVRTNKDANPKTFRWVDLFVSPTAMIAKETPKYNTPHHLRYDPEYYRIRIDVGYNLDGVAGGLRNALEKQNASFFLVLIDNEIEINEDMSVNVTANYRAYIEEAMDSNKFNALTSPEIEKDKKEQRQRWEDATQAYKDGNCTDLQLRQVRNYINGQMDRLIKKQHKSIMTSLINHERVFYADFEPKDIQKFRDTGAFDDIPSYSNQAFSVGPNSSAADHLKSLMKDKDKTPWSEHPSPHEGMRVYYFYLGDLMYLLASNLYDKDSARHVSNGIFADQDIYKSGAENTKFLLMDFDYHNSFLKTDSSRRTINVADVPISVDFFFEWYINNIIKNEVTTMGIGQFIRRMLTEMVTEAMAEVCMTGEEGHYVTFQLGSMTAGGVVLTETDGKAQFVDPITKMLFKDKMDIKADAKKAAGANPYVLDVARHYGKALPLPRLPDEVALTKVKKNGIQGLYNYVFIYGDFADPYHDGRGDEEIDNSTGTYHLHLGRDRGLVKKIGFSKNNIPYHRESRMFNQGQAGELQLSAVYDCEIDMIGNTLFLPGMELFVNPYGFGGPLFGMPQERPLGFSATVAEIDSINKKIKEASDDGSIDNKETIKISHRVEQVEERVAKDQKKASKLYINSYANVMGIGGYQLIIRIKCSIKPGSFSTTLNAKHTYTGYPAVKQANRFMDFRNAEPAELSKADSGGTTGCSAVIRNIGDDID